MRKLNHCAIVLVPQGWRLPVSSKVVAAMEKIGEKCNIEKENVDPNKKKRKNNFNTG